MEADWEVAIGAEEPVIDTSWPGFVDLRWAPHRIEEISEAQRFPFLAVALLRLNAPKSPVWTSKCDLWTLEHWDPYEMEADPQEFVNGLACYIDVLPGDGLVFERFEEAEAWARGIVGWIRQKQCRNCRADLVIRGAASINRQGFGITAYVSACGANAARAAENLDAALSELTEVIVGSDPPLISA